jgi:hypothetical protein
MRHENVRAALKALRAGQDDRSLGADPKTTRGYQPRSLKSSIVLATARRANVLDRRRTHIANRLV